MTRDRIHPRPAAALLLACSAWIAPTGADQLRFDTASVWASWSIPAGAVTITADGAVAPVAARRPIDAAHNAVRFGGGIRRAGSSAATATGLLDGDPVTGWTPDPADGDDSWWVEIDLGRGVSADRVVLSFAEEVEPFELFDLLLSTGEPQIDNVGTPIGDQVIYRVRERFRENTRHRVVFELDPTQHSPFRFVRVEVLRFPPGARLVEVDVEALGDNIALFPSQRGGGVDIQVGEDEEGRSALGNALSLADGDFFTRWRHGQAVRAPFDVWGRIIVDLGAVYWVDGVRIVSGIVGRTFNERLSGGVYGGHFISLRRFEYNAYAILTSDGSRAPDGTRRWTRQFQGGATDADRRRGLAHHSFELSPARFVRVDWLFWDANCGSDCGGAAGTTEELQVYGRGVPASVTLRSPLIDLGGSKNLNSVEWTAQIPPGTDVEIRSRTGDEVVPVLTFHDKNGKEVTERAWDKLIPSFKGPVDTTRIAGGDWSPWSNLYSVSGQSFQSPTPRRYLELEVELVTDSPAQGARLSSLALNFSEPLAESVVGEIHPVEAVPGEPTAFSYFVRPRNPRPEGFDRIEVESRAPTRFLEVRVDGDRLPSTMAPTASGFRLTLPEPVRDERILEVRFEASLFVQGTRFNVFLGNDGLGGTRQRVDPGDAVAEVASSTNVVSLPVDRGLFSNVRTGPQVVTPNGDGVNDELVLEASLVNVLRPRPLRVSVLDLSGRRVFHREREAEAGPLNVGWDGRDTGGARVAPGIYLLHVEVEGDARSESVWRVVQVAY